MAEAPPGPIYATADVLDHSDTVFETTELAPLAVKGKAQTGAGVVSGTRERFPHAARDAQQLPLIGRDAELAVLREALAAARAGTGRLIEIVGEAGVGKTRLLEALQRRGDGDARTACRVRGIHRIHPVRSLDRTLARVHGLGRDDPDGGR